MSSLTLLSKITEIAQSTVEFEEKLQNVAILLSRSFDCGLCNIFLLDKEKQSLVLKISSSPKMASRNSLSIPVGEGVIGIPLVDKKPIIIGDIREMGDPKPSIPLPLQEFSSFISIPIGDSDFTYGVLSLARKNTIKLRRGQDRLLNIISQELAGLIRNFRVYTEAKKHITELSALADVAKSISSTIELDEVLRRIVHITARVTHARSSILRVVDGATGKFRVGSKYGEPPDFCLKEPLCIPSRKSNLSYECQRVANGGAISAISVPLSFKGKLQGMLCVHDKQVIGTNKSTQFDPDDRALLGAMAGMISSALENALVFNQMEKLTEELKITQERLIESERMAAMGEIASTLAHEIRNPLVAVGGLARRIDSAIEKGLQGNSPVSKYLRVIVGEVEKLEKILHELLDFSVDKKASYARCHVNTMLEEVLGILRGDFEKADIRIVKEFSKVPPVYVDRRQIKLAISNLIANARQAMGDRGTLSLKTYGVTEDEQPMVACEIGDTGGGIPHESIYNIFNPFYTTKMYGSGLGLSIAHKIVSRNHGKISVRNESGVGATFIIKLPASTAYKEVKESWKKSS